MKIFLLFRSKATKSITLLFFFIGISGPYPPSKLTSITSATAWQCGSIPTPQPLNSWGMSSWKQVQETVLTLELPTILNTLCSKEHNRSAQQTTLRRSHCLMKSVINTIFSLKQPTQNSALPYSYKSTNSISRQPNMPFLMSSLNCLHAMAQLLSTLYHPWRDRIS